MSDNIPFDIQGEIIKRLDIKSLLQFRKVSKEWKSFIDSSYFITSYGIRPERLLVRYIDPINTQEKYISFVDDDETFAFTQTVVPRLSKPLNDSRVVGSARGLLCLYGDYQLPSHYNPGTKTAFLWNPSIRRSVGVVMPTVLKSMFERVVYGFGVCPVSSDPIIISITYRCSDIFRVQYFTLSSRVWRRIPSTNMPRDTITFTWSQVVIDKFIYFIASDKIDNGFHNRNLIMSFDLTTKAFNEIGLPDYLAHEYCVIMSISKLKESIIVLEHNMIAENPVCSVWMMDEGVTKSFTKLFTINTPVTSINALLGFRKNGRPFIETQDRDTDSSEIEVYDPCLEHFNNLGICGESGSFFVSSYMETLLLLDYLD